jgi:glycine oxidase
MIAYDAILIGQGLAGTTLAWHLLGRGLRVCIIDRESSNTSSKIAAGLITPITGMRLVKTWRFDECFAYTTQFYDQVEKQTQSRFFFNRKMVRLFANETEQSTFQRRMTDEGFRKLVQQPTPLVNEDWFANPLGGFEMQQASQLFTERYLEVSRDYFQQQDSYQTASLDLEQDIVLGEGNVKIPRLNLLAEKLILCQGFNAIRNPWFRFVRFNPAKGEILTLRIPGLHEERIIHRGVWLMPLGEERFRTGSTYEWDQLDNLPTPKGQDEILSRVRDFLRLPLEVIDHQAAVRPALHDLKPVLGFHPEYSQLAIFNGLGSKGSLLAPYFANQFADALVDGKLIDPEVSLDRK